MAKLGKQKFSILGEHDAARTTYSGTIEMYLYYSTEEDMFYFDTEEMKKYLPEDSVGHWHKSIFEGCNTKRKAVDIIEVLLSKTLKETRKLRIEIGMNSDLYNVPNPKFKKSTGDSNIHNWSFEDKNTINPELPQYLRDMLGRGGVYDSRGLTLKFYRIMEVEVNGIKRYAGCDKNWKYKKGDLSSHDENLIDWTPAAENFLIDTQNRIDEICKIVLSFFNAGDKVENLISKMETNTQFLTDGK